MTMSLKLLAALNVSLDHAELDMVMGKLESGVIGADVEGDLIVRLYLTPAGRECLPVYSPTAVA
jgi:hypothetical protein